ncbi:type II toxin-antitoxin system VapC family toxin [uncultured Desulfosarcina sp.]|uniref:type II toxin-antitoxin system VapC family toxin n=1 Tax=uncultured Desulfosarcina sp. TaxID=218289 RepID=UPI0029C78FA4|nr:type II toxin-antitoxin system VapC family toxin [uncultured Desulfosarcina sp.]
MKLILDTNAYVGFKRGYAQLVEYILQADTIEMSPIVLGELVFGFRNGSRLAQNMEELRLFLSHTVVRIVDMNEITSDRYSRIAAQLRNQGIPIPSNDIWIAAQTMQTGAELVTMDQHFEKVPGLVYSLFQLPE